MEMDKKTVTPNLRNPSEILVIVHVCFIERNTSKIHILKRIW